MLIDENIEVEVVIRSTSNPSDVYACYVENALDLYDMDLILPEMLLKLNNLSPDLLCGWCQHKLIDHDIFEDWCFFVSADEEECNCVAFRKP